MTNEGGTNNQDVVTSTTSSQIGSDVQDDATTSVTKPKSQNGDVFSTELLSMYYSRLFPYDMLHEWLSYGKESIFSHREFSFTIEPVKGEEIYIRYQSFRTKNDLAVAVHKRRPVKIDIGAIFSHPPSDHNTIPSGSFVPEARELVFDIDLTDYDSIRRCGCSGASICAKCWGFMKMAVAVVDEGLRQDFDFRHVYWFYSGRRGIHCWVCDESARELTNDGRSAVANYLNINLGTEKNAAVNLPYPLHPSLSRAFGVLEPMFIEQVIPASGHKLLSSLEEWTALLNSLPEAASSIRDLLTQKWITSNTTPAEKWQELKKHLNVLVKGKAGEFKAAKNLSTKDRNRLENWPAETVFRYAYPRLDINVSKMRNHLLKSPFCVHPKTGRVCVPIADIETFDPFAVPTLPQLMDELDQNSNAETKHSWQKTSLNAYFSPFQKNFLEPLQKEINRTKREEREQMAAIIGDF